MTISTYIHIYYVVHGVTFVVAINRLPKLLQSSLQVKTKNRQCDITHHVVKQSVKRPFWQTIAACENMTSELLAPKTRSRLAFVAQVSYESKIALSMHVVPTKASRN